MRSIFSPAQSLMANIQLKEKFIAISLIALLPGLICLGLIIKINLTHIGSYTSALKGITFTQHKNKMTTMIAKHRGLSHGYLNGKINLRTDVIALETDIDQTLTQLLNLTDDAQLQSTIQSYHPMWQSLKLTAQSDSVAKGNANSAREEANFKNEHFQAHTDLIQTINYIHFYSKDTYFKGIKEMAFINFFDLYGSTLPKFSDLIGQLRGHTASVAAKRKFTPDSYIATNSYISQVKEQKHFLDYFSQISSLKQFKLNELIDASQGYLSFLEQRLVNPDTIQTTHQEVFGKGTTLIAQFNQSSDTIKRQLTQDIQTALDSAQQTLLLIVGLFIVCIVCSLYLFSGFYLSTMESVNLVKEMSKKMAKGDLTVNVTANTNDELGEICTMIHQMASNFSTIIANTQKTVVQVVEEAEKIDTLSKQADKDMLKQQSQLDMIASAMSEMSEAAVDIQCNTERTAHSVNMDAIVVYLPTPSTRAVDALSDS